MTYSRESASTGLRREALRAGTKPNTTPMREEAGERKRDGCARIGQGEGIGDQGKHKTDGIGKQHAQSSAHDADKHRFDEELGQHVALTCADSHAYADFTRALRNGYEHDVHDADAADDKGNERNAGNEQRHGAGSAFNGLAYAVGVDGEEILLATMLDGKEACELFFRDDRTDLIADFDRDGGDISRACDPVHERRVRRPQREVFRGAEGCVLFCGNADDLERLALEQNDFTEGIFSAGKEFLLVFWSMTTTAALARTSSSLNMRPCAMDSPIYVEILYAHAVHLGGDEIFRRVRSPEEEERGGNWLYSSAVPARWRSSTVSVRTLPARRSPKPLPGMMSMVLVPIALISARFFSLRSASQSHDGNHRGDADEMPSMVRRERSLWAKIACTRHAQGFKKLITHKQEAVAPGKGRSGMLHVLRFRGAAGVGNDFAVPYFYDAAGIVGNMSVMGDQNDGMACLMQFHENGHDLFAAF